MKKKGFIVAGEASADLYGACLIKELEQVFPVEMVGIGGEKLKESGVSLIATYTDISVVGLSEVFSHLRKIMSAIKRVEKWIRENSPDFVILIDFPDFNFRVIKRIRRWYRGKIIYLVSPQVWAWRRNRRYFIKKNVDKMIVILPFEKKIYEEIDYPVEYLGHPLMDLVKPSISIGEFKKKYGIKEEGTIISIFAGSREKELLRHKDILKNVIERLKLSYSKMFFCLVPANEKASEFLKREFNTSRTIIVESEDNYNAIFASQVVLAKSGTTTLEVAIAKRPAVVFYKVNALSYLAGKWIVKVPYISLPNLILNEMVYPEFVQKSFTPENLFGAVKRFLEDTDLYISTVEKLTTLGDLLGQAGFFKRAANKIKEWVNG